MKDLKILAVMLLMVMLTLPIVALMGCSSGCKSCEEHTVRAYTIVAMMPEEPWRSGKFSGVTYGWIIRSVADTTLLAEITDANWNGMTREMFFNHRLGDTVHFSGLNKNKFFRVTRPYTNNSGKR